MTTPHRLPLTLCLLIIVFPLLGEAFYSPMLVDLMQNFSLTPLWVELTVASFYIGLALGTVFWYYSISHLGQRLCLLAGFLFYLAGTAIGLTAECGWTVFGARLIQGFGSSIGFWVLAALSSESKGVVQGNLIDISALLTLVLTPLVGFFVGGYCAEAFGFKSYFFVLGAFNLMLLAYSFLGFPKDEIGETNVSGESIAVSMRKLAQQKEALLGIVTLGLIVILFIGYCGGTPWLLMHKVGLSASQYGSLGLFIIGPCLAAGFMSIRLMKSFSRERVIWTGSWVLGSGAVLMQGMLLLPLENNLLATTLYWVISTVVIWFGVGLICIPSLQIAIGQDRTLKIEKIPLVGLFLEIFAAIGGIILGVMADITLQSISLFLLIVSGLFIVVSYRLRFLKKCSDLVETDENF